MSLLASVIEQAQHGLGFRLIDESDRDFLKELYGTTRAAELEMVPWDDQQKAEFVEMQFTAQYTFYAEQFVDAECAVLTKNKQDIGRLYLDCRKDELRIIDIALMPNYQKMGLGKALLVAVQALASTLALPITIHVEKNNTAMQLYQTLGFNLVEDQGVYNLMRWLPDAKSA